MREEERERERVEWRRMHASMSAEIITLMKERETEREREEESEGERKRQREDERDRERERGMEREREEERGRLKEREMLRVYAAVEEVMGGLAVLVRECNESAWACARSFNALYVSGARVCRDYDTTLIRIHYFCFRNQCVGVHLYITTKTPGIKCGRQARARQGALCMQLIISRSLLPNKCFCSAQYTSLFSAKTCCACHAARHLQVSFCNICTSLLAHM